MKSTHAWNVTEIAIHPSGILGIYTPVHLYNKENGILAIPYCSVFLNDSASCWYICFHYVMLYANTWRNFKRTCFLLKVLYCIISKRYSLAFSHDPWFLKWMRNTSRVNWCTRASSYQQHAPRANLSSPYIYVQPGMFVENNFLN